MKSWVSSHNCITSGGYRDEHSDKGCLRAAFIVFGGPA
jgi:hypothetical protein